MQTGKYFLSRVMKLGELNQQKLIDALIDSKPITIGKFTWVITDVDYVKTEGNSYVFGKLSKYSQEGTVKLVDESRKIQVDALAQDLLVASSPFVYIPEFSGLAYLQVWNEIQDDVFPRRIKSLVEWKYDNFFVDCTIEPVSDYASFIAKLIAFDEVNEISATVHPPNPLFGRLWEDLNEYVKRRGATEVKIEENTKKTGGLKTKIIDLINGIMGDSNHVPELKVDIADAAILMAADGYGKGKVSGTRKKKRVVVKTSDSQLNFDFEKDPVPVDLANAARAYFEKLASQRDMKH